MQHTRPGLLLPLITLLSLLLYTQVVIASPVKRAYNALELRVSLAVRDNLAIPADIETLLRRDVVVPRITSPDATSVWPIGSQQVVTWDTSDFPPDEQITNPIGRVILGRDSGDSLNLDFNNPLAQGFRLRDGRVTITVPNVPPRNDYLIVLMGDSGNTSPSFAITSIAQPGQGGIDYPAQSASITGSVTGTAIPGTLPPMDATVITEPIPISGTTITGGDPTATAIPSFTQIPRPSSSTPTITPSGSASATGTPVPSEIGTSPNTNGASGKLGGVWTMALVVSGAILLQL